MFIGGKSVYAGNCGSLGITMQYYSNHGRLCLARDGGVAGGHEIGSYIQWRQVSPRIKRINTCDLELILINPAFFWSRWIHDYQDACVDKIERFLRGEQIAKDTMSNNSGGGSVQVGNSNSIPKTSQQYQRTSSIGSVEGRLD